MFSDLSYDDIYEFYRVGKSYRLYQVYELTNKRGKKLDRDLALRLSNAYDYNLKIRTNAETNLGTKKVSDLIVKSALIG